MGVFYLGTFPPEYGGVTIKNFNLYMALRKKMLIKKIDFSEIKRRNFKEAVKLISVLLGAHNTFVVGVTGKNTRKRFCKLLYLINRKAMNRSIMILMGGSVANDIAADQEYIKYIKEYKKVYVETDGMKKTLEAVGLINVGYYPNGRFKPQKLVVSGTNEQEHLKCVFFSLIQPQKGADIILEAAEKLHNIEFVFYGVIDVLYRQEFESKVAALENVKYMGVFKGNTDEVYEELRKYDVLLFPTKWKTEGVPGILVESKIAGLTAIVSNESYNAEIIGKNQGIVLKENSVEYLVDAISKLSDERDLLRTLKYNNLMSSEKYYIEKYIDEIFLEIK